MEIIIGNRKIILKQRLEDFQVEEIVDFEIQEQGDFGVYLLKNGGLPHGMWWEILKRGSEEVIEKFLMWE